MFVSVCESECEWFCMCLFNYVNLSLCVYFYLGISVYVCVHKLLFSMSLFVCNNIYVLYFFFCMYLHFVYTFVISMFVYMFLSINQCLNL